MQEVFKVFISFIYSSCNVCRFSLPSGVLFGPHDKESAISSNVCLIAPHEITNISMSEMLDHCPPWCPLSLIDPVPAEAVTINRLRDNNQVSLPVENVKVYSEDGFSFKSGFMVWDDINNKFTFEESIP